MKILRLVIESFGDQRDKIIDFSKNTNVIMSMSPNTLKTIQAFLDAMLFGQSAEDKKRYRPKRLPYKGSLVFENDKGEELQVDRNFLKDSFRVINIDGTDVTDEYSDEFGDLTLLPIPDTIFAQETYRIPSISEREKEKLKEIQEKRLNLEARYNYDKMIAERDRIVEELNHQKKLEEELSHNSDLILKNEARVQQLNEDLALREEELNQRILKLKSENQKLELEINKLKVRVNEIGKGKTQVLQRDVQSTEKQIEVLNARIEELRKQEYLYTEKLDKLKENFQVDRKELKTDFDNYQSILDKESNNVPEPLVDKLASYSTWIYLFLILLCTAGITYALYNPNDALTRVPIYLICFFSVFIILFSAVIIFVRARGPRVATVTPSSPINVSLNEITEKYNKITDKDFSTFYSDAKLIFKKIDNIELDLKDIRSEIGASIREKEKLEGEQNKIKFELIKNQSNFESASSLQDKIVTLTKEKNSNLAEIEELTEERNSLKGESIWKLKEESLRLDEVNQELVSQTDASKALLESFNKVQEEINQYESTLNSLEKQERIIRQNIENTKSEFVNNYAVPGEENYSVHLAEQFNIGLLNNLRSRNDVPYITYNPFENAGEINDDLINKFKSFIQSSQALVFMSEINDLDIFRDYNLKYNGIFIK